LIRIYSHVNHRNHVEFVIRNRRSLHHSNCCGTLIKLDQIERVPSLLHINESIKCVTPFTEILLTKEQWLKRRSQYIRRNRINIYRRLKREAEKVYQELIEEKYGKKKMKEIINHQPSRLGEGTDFKSLSELAGVV